MAGDFTFLKGNIETIILCALFNGDKYGYEIAKEIKERTQNQYEIKQPTLYSYLKRLETQDLIESYWGAESNGGRRRYYKLTDLGRLHCQAFMNEWQYHKSVLETLVDTSTTPQSTISQEDVTQLFGTKQKKTKRQREVSVESLDDADEISKRLSQLQAQSQPAMEETSAQEDASKTTEVEQVADATATQPVEETKEVVASQPITEPQVEVVANSNVPTTQSIEEVVEQPAQEVVVDRFALNQEDATSFLQKFEQKAQEIANRPVADTAPETGENYQHILMTVLGDQIGTQVQEVQQQTDAQKLIETNRNQTLESVADELAQKGIKMRIYNRTTAQYRSKSLVPTNKINCLTAWLTFFATIVLLAGVCLATFNTGVWPIFAVIGALLIIPPIVLTGFAIAKPIRREKPTYDYKHLLILAWVISAIVIMLSIGINTLFLNIKFSDGGALATQILLPSILSLILPFTAIFYNKVVSSYE